jgi:hypothetical protein
MKTYHVDLTVADCTSVDAETAEEAEQIAYDIFKENGYNMHNAELDAYEMGDA